MHPDSYRYLFSMTTLNSADIHTCIPQVSRKKGIELKQKLILSNSKLLIKVFKYHRRIYQKMSVFDYFVASMVQLFV